MPKGSPPGILGLESLQTWTKGRGSRGHKGDGAKHAQTHRHDGDAEELVEDIEQEVGGTLNGRGDHNLNPERKDIALHSGYAA